MINLDVVSSFNRKRYKGKTKHVLDSCKKDTNSSAVANIFAQALYEKKSLVVFLPSFYVLCSNLSFAPYSHAILDC